MNFQSTSSGRSAVTFTTHREVIHAHGQTGSQKNSRSAMSRFLPARTANACRPREGLDTVHRAGTNQENTVNSTDPPLPHPLLEPPDPDPGTGGASLTVDRSFAFVDICGFTSYCEHYGEHLALELLIEFRQITRAVVARRAARVSKWLGDGVMIVGLEPALLAAACAEIGLRCSM